jgi:hypothetical protein
VEHRISQFEDKIGIKEKIEEYFGEKTKEL